MADQTITKSERICKVEGCSNNVHGGGMCSKHYQRLKKNPGKDVDRRMISDSNEIVIEKDHARIFLYNIKGEKEAEAIIDLDDVEKVSKWKWHKHSAGYVETCSRSYHFFLHRFVNNTPKGIKTDHRNGIKLDNRKQNLRNATHSQNLCNRGRQANSLAFKGVHWHKKRQKWYSTIKCREKEYYLGSFCSEVDAAKAYNAAALLYHKEFAKLNDIGFVSQS